MGLREDAEAARLAGVENREREARERECLRIRRENEKRDAEYRRALDAGEAIGITWDEDQSFAWVTDPPVASGYLPQTYLHLRSDDGVWLRYAYYAPTRQHRWMVVQRCPQGNHWVIPSAWKTTLEGIGEQLRTLDETLRWHTEKFHLSSA